MRLTPSLMGCLLLCLIHTAHTTVVTPIECGGTLTGNHGRFSSPGYPVYANNLNCSWWIHAPPGSLINLTLDPFEVEYQADCYYDSLKIYDGESDTDTLLGSFCGYNPQSVNSSGDVLYFRFTTDGSATRKGFEANWTSKTQDTTVVTPIECDGTLTGDHGRFSSPGYPDYVNNLNCSWWIRAPPGSLINLTLDPFDLENHKHCDYDSLKIYDGESDTDTLLGTFCGSNPQSVNSSGDVLYLRFKTDFSETRVGFIASWTSETQDTTDCYEGNGANYRGEVSVTESGAVCVPWSEYPLYINRHPGKGLGDHSYCRNPDDDKRPWCRLDLQVEKKVWDFCKIERCSNSTTDQPIPATTTYEPIPATTTEKPTPATTTEEPIPATTTEEPTPATTTDDPTAIAFTKDCYEGNGTNYRGEVSVTENGPVCLLWSNFPWLINNFPGKGLGDHNYCRNPDGDKRPWCKANTVELWAYCKIERCSNSTTDEPIPATTTHEPATTTTTFKHTTTTTTFKPITSAFPTDCYEGKGTNYRGEVSVTEKGTVCLPWSGKNLFLSNRTCPWEDLTGHNYCRNPDRDVKPWCWVNVTLDSSGWGYCKVERCTADQPTTARTAYEQTTATAYEPTSTSTTGWSGQCGARQYEERRYLVGGYEVGHGFAPWQARVQRVVNCRAPFHTCGAVIISEYWLLSAAHCFEGSKKSHWRMIVGDHHKYQHDEGEQTFEVEDFIVHEDYVNEDKAKWNKHLAALDNDIALIKVKPRNGKGIEFNDYVQPACLPTEATAYTPGTECIISGWGDVDPNPEYYAGSDILKGGKVHLIADSQCKHNYKNVKGANITKGMTCARHDGEIASTCQGDSGGPLVSKIGDAYTVLGITSYGTMNCGAYGHPTVFAKVQHFLSWINQII